MDMEKQRKLNYLEDKYEDLKKELHSLKKEIDFLKNGLDIDLIKRKIDVFFGKNFSEDVFVDKIKELENEEYEIVLKNSNGDEKTLFFDYDELVYGEINDGYDDIDHSVIFENSWDLSQKLFFAGAELADKESEYYDDNSEFCSVEDNDWFGHRGGFSGLQYTAVSNCSFAHDGSFKFDKFEALGYVDGRINASAILCKEVFEELEKYVENGISIDYESAYNYGIDYDEIYGQIRSKIDEKLGNEKHNIAIFTRKEKDWYVLPFAEQVDMTDINGDWIEEPGIIRESKPSSHIVDTAVDILKSVRDEVFEDINFHIAFQVLKNLSLEEDVAPKDLIDMAEKQDFSAIKEILDNRTQDENKAVKTRRM